MKVLPVIIDQNNQKLKGRLSYGDVFTIVADDRVPNNHLVRGKKFIAVPQNYLSPDVAKYWDIRIKAAQGR